MQFSRWEMDWRSMLENPTRTLSNLLKRCETHLLNPCLLYILQVRTVAQNHAPIVTGTRLLTISATKNQSQLCLKLPNVSGVSKHSTVKMSLTITKQLGVQSNLCARFVMWTVLITVEDGSMKFNSIEIVDNQLIWTVTFMSTTFCFCKDLNSDW